VGVPLLSAHDIHKKAKRIQNGKSTQANQPITINNTMAEILRSGSGDLTTPFYSHQSSTSFAALSSKLDSITTEGWLELFLNAAEKRTFSRWQEEINDKSLTHRATKNSFDRIASLFPDNVAPNLITAAGL